MKNKIMYIGNYELPDKDASALRVVANCKIFNEIGFECIIVDAKKSYQVDNDIFQTKKVSDGYTEYSVNYPKGKMEWLRYLISVEPFVTLIDSISHELYAVILYDYPAHPMSLIMRHLRKLGIKCISDVTEWYPTQVGGILYRITKVFDVNIRMRYLNKKSDGIIAVSKYLTEYYTNAKKNVVQIPPLTNCLNVSDYGTYEKSSTRPVQFYYAGFPFYIGKTGSNRVLMKDRIDWIIDILYKTYTHGGKFNFCIIGITKSEFLDILPSYSNVIDQLDSCIRFYGKQSHKKTVEIIRNSDYLILFRDETRYSKAGFSTKCVEAISHGVSLLVNDSTGIGDYIENGKDGYILNLSDQDKSMDIVHDICDLNRDQINEMKERCYNKKIFDYTKYCTIMRSFIERL